MTYKGIRRMRMPCLEMRYWLLIAKIKGPFSSGVLCDWRMPTRLNEEFYRTSIRSTMTYGAKCWPINKQHMHNMGVANMRMLRWMCDKIRKDKIRNEGLQEHLGVALIGDKFIVTCLQCFGHV
eukprot:TRINITY_DN2724_c0_g2_i4.p1 TRINITY_DN2724_c0_g2~~TRINITY_DN2724_c0_g2_i4.p1  ORF type:complete len:123 (+),score=6.81 TRINITY_DN2724_c0_g2_i4:830-1198(+)